MISVLKKMYTLMFLIIIISTLSCCFVDNSEENISQDSTVKLIGSWESIHNGKRICFNIDGNGKEGTYTKHFYSLDKKIQSNRTHDVSSKGTYTAGKNGSFDMYETHYFNEGEWVYDPIIYPGEWELSQKNNKLRIWSDLNYDGDYDDWPYEYLVYTRVE